MLTDEPDQDRQRRVPDQVLPEVVAPALHREPAELVREHVLEHDDVDEDRDRQADRADDHHHAVGQRAAHVRDGERQADRDDRLEDEQRHQHRQRRPEPRREDVRHRLVGAPRRAEVGGQDLLDEDPELDVVRLVDAELAPDVVDLLGIGDLAGEHVRRVAAEQVEQDEHQQHDAEHRREHLPEPAERHKPTSSIPLASRADRTRVDSHCAPAAPCCDARTARRGRSCWRPAAARCAASPLDVGLPGMAGRRRLSSCNQFVPGRDVDVLPLRRQDRVLAVALTRGCDRAGCDSG